MSPREAILAATASFEIIESYPEDKYLPSYLVRAEYAGRVFHVLFATDAEQGNVRIVTRSASSFQTPPLVVLVITNLGRDFVHTLAAPHPVNPHLVDSLLNQLLYPLPDTRHLLVWGPGRLHVPPFYFSSKGADSGLHLSDSGLYPSDSRLHPSNSGPGGNDSPTSHDTTLTILLPYT